MTLSAQTFGGKNTDAQGLAHIELKVLKINSRVLQLSRLHQIVYLLRHAKFRFGFIMCYLMSIVSNYLMSKMSVFEFADSSNRLFTCHVTIMSDL